MNKYVVTILIIVALLNISFIKSTEKTLIIDSKTKYFNFIRGNYNDYTKIVIQGAKLSGNTAYTFENDSAFDKLIKNTFLKELGIYGCSLKSIPDKICLNKNLTFLALSSNRIIDNNKNLKKLVNLTSLSLDNNEIKDMNPFIKTLKKMRKLVVIDFSNNKIESIPESICTINSLKDLHLSHNNIKIIPCCLSKMNLDQLSIAFNQVLEVPCCFNKSYANGFILTIDNKPSIPKCFWDTLIPKQYRIQIN